MSINARDTQFAGFAHALYMECANVHQEALVRGSIDTDQLIIQHMTRRAYDLVAYILKNADPIDLDTSGEYCPMNDEEAARRIANLPDMIEWPDKGEK